MSAPQGSPADAAVDAPAASPFTVIAGDPAAMVCEGDVCYVPGADIPAE